LKDISATFTSLRPELLKSKTPLYGD